jgi:hypothetical protein
MIAQNKGNATQEAAGNAYFFQERRSRRFGGLGTEEMRVKSQRQPLSPLHPEKDGRAGIRGGCSTCFSLYDLHQARLALDAAQREFVRRAGPWVRRREPRAKKAVTATEEPPLRI